MSLMRFFSHPAAFKPATTRSTFYVSVRTVANGCRRLPKCGNGCQCNGCHCWAWLACGCQPFPTVAKGCQRLATVANGCQRLPTVDHRLAWNCTKLRQNTSERNREHPERTRDHPEAPQKRPRRSPEVSQGCPAARNSALSREAEEKVPYVSEGVFGGLW